MDQIIKEPRSNKAKKPRNKKAIDQIVWESRSNKLKKPRSHGSDSQRA